MRLGITAALVLDVSERLRLLGFERMEVTANPHAMPFSLNLGFVVHGGRGHSGPSRSSDELAYELTGRSVLRYPC